MRGVYGLHAYSARNVVGSSPRARGLLCSSASRCMGVRDHPRVRGVYIIDRHFRVNDAGSSPRARGLHGDSGKVSRLGGIIPACAGFTYFFFRNERPLQDHPRVRGVYSKIATIYLYDAGSSPRARGLRSEPRLPIAPRRIIPACAGFTSRHK